MVYKSLKVLGLASSQAKLSTLLTPFLVEADIARLGRRRLSLEEQRAVMRAIADPSKVNWPDWWWAHLERGNATQSE